MKRLFLLCLCTVLLLTGCLPTPEVEIVPNKGEQKSWQMAAEPYVMEAQPQLTVPAEEQAEEPVEIEQQGGPLYEMVGATPTFRIENYDYGFLITAQDCPVYLPDVSAVPVTVDDSPEVVAVVSVALCRNGAVPGAEFRESTLSAGQSQTGRQDSPNPTENNQPHKENAMDYKAILLKLLGLPEDASDEAVGEAVEKLNEGQSQTGHQDSNPAGGVAPLAARIDALERRADKAEKDAILARARAEGRVVALSAEAVAKLSPRDLEETVAKTPATVPLSAVTPGAVRETAAKTPPDEETLKLARMCGVDPEALA